MKSHKPGTCSSCAACRYLKRKCTPKCRFAPYFKPDELNKFVKVHKVFKASNVCKILNEVGEEQREGTVNSLVYEAEIRLSDPVYGCVGVIASLQRKIVKLQNDLLVAKACRDHYANLDTFFDDIPMSSEFLENFNHNTLASDHDQSLFINEFSPFPFP